MRTRPQWDMGGEPAVLIYENRKMDGVAWAFTTPAERRAAGLALVRYLDTTWNVYHDLDTAQTEWLRDARAGDAQAAWKLLQHRRDYEYETFKIVYLETT